MTMNRRDFLASTVLIAGAGTLFALPNSAASQSLRVRKDISSLASNDPVIETYRHAVEAMHTLPASDERSWISQAYMHYDHCHRQTEHFFPWHRLFIHSFEDIVRHLTGDNTWALPYWNWSQNRRIPGVFFGSGEPLDTSTWNDPAPAGGPTDREMGQTDSIAVESVSLEKISDQDFFAVFSSLVEWGPHGAVHGSVGGHMALFHSPLDPIFMVHHCDVDRLWAHWNQQHTNPTQSDWLSEGFDDMFVDRNGEFIQGVTANDLLDIAALGYTYDDLPPAPVALSEVTDVTRRRTPDVGELLALFDERGMGVNNDLVSTVGIPTVISVAASDNTRLQRATTASVRGRGKQILARLTNIRIPEQADNYVIRVFLNCPYISEKVETTDPHFVAAINLFGLREMTHRGENNPSVLLNLTDTVETLSQGEFVARETLQDVFQVQLMPVPFQGRAPVRGEFSVGRVDIVAVEEDSGGTVPLATE